MSKSGLSPAGISAATKPILTKMNDIAQKTPNKIRDEIQALRPLLQERETVTQEQLEKIVKSIAEKLMNARVQAEEKAKAMVPAQSAQKIRKIAIISGFSVGFAAAAGAAFYVIRRQSLKHHHDDDITAELPRHKTERNEKPGVKVLGLVRALSDKTGLKLAKTHKEPEEYSCVGDVRTKKFVTIVSETLPEEEHRIYFHNEKEAVLAGYHSED